MRRYHDTSANTIGVVILKEPEQRDLLLDVHVRGGRVLARQMKDVHQDKVHQLDLAAAHTKIGRTEREPNHMQSP